MEIGGHHKLVVLYKNHLQFVADRTYARQSRAAVPGQNKRTPTVFFSLLTYR